MAFAPAEWITRFREFWREVKSEMSKVTWPGRAEVISTTIVVLIAVVFFGLFLWACDLVFYRAVDFIFARFGA